MLTGKMNWHQHENMYRTRAKCIHAPIVLIVDESYTRTGYSDNCNANIEHFLGVLAEERERDVL